MAICSTTTGRKHGRKCTTNLTARHGPSTSRDAQRFRHSGRQPGELLIRLKTESISVNVSHVKVNVDLCHLIQILTTHWNRHAGVKRKGIYESINTTNNNRIIRQVAPTCTPSSNPSRHPHRNGSAPWWHIFEYTDRQNVWTCPGPALFPLKTFMCGDIHLHLIHCSLGTCESTSGMASQSVKPLLHGSRSWQIDHTTLPVAMGRM